MAEVSALVGDFEVWFRGKALDQMPERGDPFLAIGLLPAMASGQALDLRELPPVSSRLLEHLDQIQEIWAAWNPQLQRVDVRCKSISECSPRSGTGQFFSGGVDALHAALCHAADDERLVFINGFDFELNDVDSARSEARLERLAGHLNRPIETVSTNWIRFSRHHRLARSTSHGGCLVAVAHLLAPAEMTIASSNAWSRLTPWGTHPLLDPLWSSDTTTILHWGNHGTRVEKLALIARQPELLADLWVCHENAGGNCGRCDKCRRTRAILHVLGTRSPAFPDEETDPMRAYAPVTRSWVERIYIAEMLRYATESNREDLIGLLGRLQRQMYRQDVLRRARRAIVRWSGIRSRASARIDLRPWGDGPYPPL